MSGRIQQQSASYRQGLVLGLTMAEIMLLLVFCLLIAIGTILNKERGVRLDIEKKLIQSQSSAEVERRAIEAERRAAEAARQAAASDRQIADQVKNVPALREYIERGTGSLDNKKIDEFWRQLVDSSSVLEALEKQGLTRADLRESAAYLAGALKLKKAGIDLKDAARNSSLANEIKNKFGAIDEISNNTIVAAIQRGMETTGHSWPPIIKLSEADGYYFERGKAELSAAFNQKLRSSVTSHLLKTAQEYDVDVIEVVGHTDEQPIGGAKTSNLDKELSQVLAGTATIGSLRPADNAGLGLARAIAVVSVLKADPRLSEYRVLPLSGAQLILPDERLASGGLPSDIKERRRIEIRLRKSVISGPAQ